MIILFIYRYIALIKHGIQLTVLHMPNYNNTADREATNIT